MRDEPNTESAKMKKRSVFCACTEKFQLKVLGNSVGLRFIRESAGLTGVSARIATTALAAQAGCFLGLRYATRASNWTRYMS